MKNNSMKIAESDFRQFQTTNKKQHETWNSFISGIAAMDADVRFKEVAATGYIEGHVRKLGEEM